jgi:hypothetical protein
MCIYLFITFRLVTAIRIVHRIFWNLSILVFLTVHNAIWTCRFFFSVALLSLQDLGRLTYRRFHDLFRHMVGLLGRVISPSQVLWSRFLQHRKTTSTSSPPWEYQINMSTNRLNRGTEPLLTRRVANQKTSGSAQCPIFGQWINQSLTTR